MKHYLNFAGAFLVLIFSFQTGFSQSVQLSGVINRYAALVSYDSCAGLLNVSDTTGFLPNRKILVFHMAGGSMNTTNTAQYGTLLDLQQVGRYEVAEILDRAAGKLTLTKRLLYPISSGEIVQIITYPEYANVVVTDTIRALPWNGLRGGVVAFKVTGSLLLNAPVLADGMGFRGGVSNIAATNNCTWIIGESGYSFANGNWRGGSKGEGVVIGLTGQELGRGTRVNGGGGGNDHNAGGGGGGNTATGGQGGNNDEPTAFGCDGYFPGLGGKAIALNNGRLFLGGGGGAGHTNNTLSSNGAAGGGIIILDANSMAGANPTLSANGGNGMNSNGDGGGGAGAGGTIWLTINNLPVNAIVRANGGNGGTASGQSGNRCFGPGGGGSGGRILSNVMSGSFLVQGGTAGTVVSSTNGCNGTANGATNGQDGQIGIAAELPTGKVSTQVPVIVQQPQDITVCAGASAAFQVTTNPAAPSTLQWQKLEATGWVNIAGANNNTLTINDIQAVNPPAQYRCVFDGVGCYLFNSNPVSIAVTPPPVAAFVANLVAGSTYSFTNQSQNNFNAAIWNFGDNTASTEYAPTHTFPGNGAYVVTLTSWNGCDTVSVSYPISISLPPTAIFTVADTIQSCNTAQVVFSNTSLGADTYQWTFLQGNPAFSTAAQPQVTYLLSGNYNAQLIATNSGGSDTTSTNFYVKILAFPVANFTAIDLPASTTVQFEFTGSGALFYTWNFGDGSAISNEESPIHVFPAGGVYQVRLLIQNECGASILEQVITVVNENVAVTPIANAPTMLLYPNPSVDGFWLTNATLPIAVNVIDMNGRIVRQLTTFKDLTTYIDATGLAAGTYFVQAIFADGQGILRWVKRA